jgi:hypothetical protein
MRRRRVHRFALGSRSRCAWPDVVVLDKLEPHLHRCVAPDLLPSVELIVGDVGDVALADRALAR